MISLRPRQEDAINLIRQSLKERKKRPCLAAPTGFGKTRTAAAILDGVWRKGNRGIFILDRIQLIDQTVKAFDGFGIPCGVIQADHERTDPRQPIQIASVQTLQRRRRLPDVDIAIIDECDMCYSFHRKMAEMYNAIPFIGLTATPYTKSMGTLYNNLLVPATMKELISEGFLTPIRYYAPDIPDLKGIRSAMSKYGSDWHQGELGERMNTLVGNVVDTWIKLGEGRQTACFASSINHSKNLCKEFNERGIPAYHIDAYTPVDERRDGLRAYEAGEYKIISCCTLLDTGFDSPNTTCIVDANPTKSVRKHVQKYGRGVRINDAHKDCIVLDHAGNTLRHGFVEDIVPMELCDGTKKDTELLKKDKKEKKDHLCPMCSHLHCMFICPSCGYKPEVKDKIEVQVGNLVELKKAPEPSKADRERFYAMMLYHANTKGYNQGWAYHKTMQKFGMAVSGGGIKPIEPDEKARGYIKHLQIRNAKRRAG